jgi:hypothetical protein
LIFKKIDRKIRGVRRRNKPNMKKLFPGYYRLSKNDYSKLWRDCIFAFDANVLLNLYRYSPETRDEFLGILKDNSNRLWLPYQTALEYHQKRLIVIQQLADAYGSIQKLLKDTQNKIEDEFNTLAGRGRHPFIDETHFIEKITRTFTELEEEILNLSKKHPDLIDNDPVLEIVTTLFDGKVGSPYSFEQLTNVFREGEDRYKKKIPPGYRDNEKDDTNKYGDLVIWFQLIDFAKKEKHPIIFVTDDRKEDWWLKIKGRTIGPRPELIQEIVLEADILFYMYSADPFLEHARQYLKRKINQKAVDEIRDIRQREEESMQVGADTLELLKAASRFPSPPPDWLKAASTAAEAAARFQDQYQGSLAAAAEAALKFPSPPPEWLKVAGTAAEAALRFPSLYPDWLKAASTAAEAALRFPSPYPDWLRAASIAAEAASRYPGISQNTPAATPASVKLTEPQGSTNLKSDDKGLSKTHSSDGNMESPINSEDDKQPKKSNKNSDE